MKKIFCLVFGLITWIAAGAFAENYYICAGSFEKRDNAAALKAELEKTHEKVFLSQFERDDGKTFYRVLIETDTEDRKKALSEKDAFEQTKTARDLKIRNAWVLVPQVVEIDPDSLFERADGTEELSVDGKTADFDVVAEKVLEKNEAVTEEIEAGDKKYSVLVNTYREESVAENDKERLCEQDIDAYVLKKFDEKDLFSFDLHAGKCETPEEAVELQNVIEEKGIETKEVVNYEDFRKKIEDYNNVVQTQEVVYSSGHTEISESVGKDVVTVLKQFPVNRDFQIKDVFIADCRLFRENDFNQRLAKKYFVDSSIKGLMFDLYESDAISSVTYYDDLFGKKVTVLIAEKGEENQKKFDFSVYFGDYDTELTKEMKFNIPYGVLNCVLFCSQTDGGRGKYSLLGTTEDGKIAVYMDLSKFTEKEITEFFEKSYRDSNALLYPQLRKTLFAMADSDAVKREFVCYCLEQVDSSYAEERGYVDWSVQIVGHWKSELCLLQENKPVVSAFFDMDYDYNAKKIHNLFMNDKGSMEINEENHPETVRNVKDAWYTRGELSFCVDSYITAIDSRSWEVNLEELKTLAEDLKIWK